MFYDGELGKDEPPPPFKEDEREDEVDYEERFKVVAGSKRLSNNERRNSNNWSATSFVYVSFHVPR